MEGARGEEKKDRLENNNGFREKKLESDPSDYIEFFFHFSRASQVKSHKKGEGGRDSCNTINRSRIRAV